MRRVVGSGFVEIWGPIDELPGDKAAVLRPISRPGDVWNGS